MDIVKCIVDPSSISGKFSNLGKEPVARIRFADFLCNDGVEGLQFLGVQGFKALEYFVVLRKAMIW